MLKCIKERIEATATAGNRVSSIDALFLLLRADPCIAQYQWFREALNKLLKRACSMSSSIFSVGKRLHCIEDLRHACIQNNVKQHKWLKEKRHQIENSTNFKSREIRTAYGEVALKKRRLARIETFVSLSKSNIWDRSKKFYMDMGIGAWQNGTVPYGISSSSFIARIYAEKINRLYSASREKPYLGKKLGQVSNGHEPMYVLELGAGHMKLGYLTLKTLFSRYFGEGRIQDAPRFPFKFILCDICPEVVLHCSKAECFQSFVNMGILDFSYCDLKNLHRDGIKLIHSKKVIKTKSISSSLVVISNYYFDSLPIDLYVWGGENANPSVAEIIVSECNVERFKTQSVSNLYDRISNKSIADYVMRHQLANSYFSVPVGALCIIQNIKKLLCSPKVPFMWLFGDKVHSPSDDSVLRIQQGGFLPSLVRHGQDGCISVTIDNEMIGQVILDGMHQKCIEHTGQTNAFQVSAASNRYLPKEDGLSVSDWESLSQYFIEECIDSATASDVLDLLCLGHFEYSVFEEIQWDLAKKARSSTEQYRSVIIGVALKCYDNRYFLSQEASLQACLNFCRWMYVMNAKHHLFEKVFAYLLRSKKLLSSAQEKATSRLQLAASRKLT